MNKTSYRVLCRVDRIDGDVMYLDIPGYVNAPFPFYMSAVDNSELVDLIEQDYRFHAKMLFENGQPKFLYNFECDGRTLSQQEQDIKACQIKKGLL